MLISAQNRSATLTQTTLNATGETFKDVFFDTSDTIKKSETYYVEFTCKKDYPQVQDVYLTGTAVSGSGDIVITVYGKKFTGSDYTSIGTSTWNSALPLDEVITISTSNRYRYYKVEFVSDTTTKKVLLTDMRFKTWLTGGDLSTASLSLSSNLAVTGTTTLTGAVGSAASITLGAGADLIGSTTSDINFGSGNFTVAGASGNTSIGGDITLENSETISNALDGSIITDANVVIAHQTSAANSTVTLSATQMLAGVITSTSGAAVTFTTPTATAIMALIPGGARGTTFDLIIDNSAGSSTITMTLDGSIAVITPAITGGDALTVSTANVVGCFRFYFTSATAAKVLRIY